MPRKAKQTDLVQIQRNPIPAWHQSLEPVTSCPTFYVAAEIQGKKQPGGLDSARGKQVHKTGASYASWCAHKEVEMDLEAFDRFTAGAGPAAAKILAGMRDSYRVDFRNLLATEITMSLDENLQPTNIAKAIEGIVVDSGLPPAFVGTLDALYMYRQDLKAFIDDLKTHFIPYEPEETLQAKMYALLVFLHFPWVMEVRFRLIFVRYKDLKKDVTYMRSDVPSLTEAIKSARALQIMIHEEYDSGKKIEAIGGPQCVYCPLLSNRSCPVAEYNSNMQLTMEERVSFKLWYESFNRINNAALKDYVQGSGRKVILKNHNGKHFVFGPEESESTIYPVFQATADGILTDKDNNPIMPIVSLLLDTTLIPLEDRGWLGKLVISSSAMDSALKKAKKRVLAHHAITDAAEHITKVRMKVSKPLDTLPEEVIQDNEEWSEEGEDF